MQNGKKWLGPGEKTYEYLLDINNKGADELIKIRNDINKSRGDGHHRNERTWGAQQAAEMIGRSPQWLRDTDPDVPKNAAGHGRWTLGRIIGLMEQAGTLYKRPKGSRALITAMAKFKGGVGNTTNTLHLAHGLAMKGLRVLIWDWDAQASATQGGGGKVPDLELDDEDLPLDIMANNPKGILDPNCKVVMGTYFHNVDLIPANSALNELELTLITQFLGSEDSTSEIRPEHRMAAVLAYIKEHYDVILIDCPPTLGMNSMNGLLAADGVITSLKPELLDRASLVAFTDALAGMCSNYGKTYEYFRILISQYQDGITTDPTSGTVGGSVHRRNELALRQLYGEAVMESMMYHSREIGSAATEMSTVLANEKPVGSRAAYKRAVSVVNDVVNEVYNDLVTIWESEADDDGE